MLALNTLLAENGLHKYLGLGWSALGGLVLIVGTFAVMRYRQAASESKDKEQDETITKLSEAVTSLPTMLSENFGEIKISLAESEAKTKAQLMSLEKTITKKVDSVKDELSKQATRVAVLSSEVTHLKKG